MTSNKLHFLLSACVLVAACGDEPVIPPGTGTPNPGSDMPQPTPGQTDFVTEEAGNGSGLAQGESGRAGNSAPGGAATDSAAPTAAPTPPGGRVADVEEADIYKVDQNRLFYLNTYKGFVIYDVNDPKNPQRLSRLPVFGYPVEMFVAGNTVYALLRDALYLTQVGQNLQFERHNVSQLVAIDITDLRNPKVIKTIDIIGELREGVSRKIDNSIYVVSYIPQTYYWGWRPEPGKQKEQAWVYSFDVTDPANVRKVEEMLIFEGGSVDVRDPNGTYSYHRNFGSVALSATSNALMVVENWHVSAYSSGGRNEGDFGCGSYNSNQIARVSVIDVSNPSGDIALQARFETEGQLQDQFKMTYVHDPVANTGTFYGIFAKQVWSSNGCRGDFYTQNTLESWDVSVTGQPQRLGELRFGKPNETVRGSAYDVERKVVYAITAQRIDPLYAISFADRQNLRVLSEIDGLSGEMSVFRLVGGNNFLLAVGQDASVSCTGFQDTDGWRATKMAVSLIDVRDLNQIRLVQRQCVAVKNADWIGSDITGNLDQAHKLLGMHFDGQVNVITVPVYYSKRIGTDQDWWWHQWETAVGLMTWDLAKYNPALPETQQTVIENFGTFVHPHGEVRRSIVFTHQGATPRRMMINLSDTHISVADLVDMRNPKLESVIEVAPYYNQIYRFGDYLVEQVQSKPNDWGPNGPGVSTFRVKPAGGNLEDVVASKSIDIGQVSQVYKHDNSLVLMRQVSNGRYDQNTGQYVPPRSEALVMDFRDPANPRLAGRVAIPMVNSGYYRFWCGTGAYWGGFWFDHQQNFATTSQGLAFYTQEWKQRGNEGYSVNKLVFLNLLNPDAPTVSESMLPENAEWGSFGLVPDPIKPDGFYITYRNKVGEQKTAEGFVYARYRYYAQRWEPVLGTWQALHAVNTPGRLIRTWGNARGERMFLSQDHNYRVEKQGENTIYLADYRLSLLRRIDLGGRPAAELLDSRVLTNLYPAALLVEGDKLLMNGRPQQNYYWGGAVAEPGVAVSGTGSTQPLPSWETTSDRLMIFDMSQNRLTSTYDQPTRMYNVQLMGTHQGRLFVNLAGGGRGYSPWGGYGQSGGDGILVIDIQNPAAPYGVKFLRTLGYATHIEFFGSDVYVASGHFGLFHMNLLAPSDLPIEPVQ